MLSVDEIMLELLPFLDRLEGAEKSIEKALGDDGNYSVLEGLYCLLIADTVRHSTRFLDR